MNKTYWIRYKANEFKKNPQLVLDMLTELRIKEIEYGQDNTYKEM
tara:strand:+ start:385 stop:519 length:135 start_codon:yes stop_codon:yes gene_type:complete